MKTDVEITVTGLPFDEKAVSGITIQYGINIIPMARLSLDAAYIQSYSPDFLCNPTTYKKRTKLVQIRIKSTTGCLSFDGYFDGLNISQSPGGFEYEATIKNQFQRLVEVFPKYVGIFPSSCIPFSASPALKCSFGDPDAQYQANEDSILPIDTNVTIGEYVLEYVKGIAKSQLTENLNLSVDDDLNPLFKLMTETIYAENVKAADELMPKIDASYLKDCPISAQGCAPSIRNILLGEQADLWSLMLEAFNYIGCCVIVANGVAFVVPQASFLKITQTKPNLSQQASSPNHAYPADYNNLSISDNGYVNIRYCYIISNSETGNSGILDNAGVMQYLGVYPSEGASNTLPDDGSSGILIINADSFLFNASTFCFMSNDKVQSDLQSSQVPYCGEIIKSIKESNAAHVEYQKKLVDPNKAQRKVMDQYAEMKLLQAKFSDRCGSVNCIFNPKWVPGTTGMAYTRTPGTFINFYVLSVTHSVVKTAPSGGSASTQVTFNSTRQGTSGGIPGVDNASLYGYTTQKMEAMQKAWVDDVKKQ